VTINKMNEPIIRPFEFIGRMNKYVLIPYYLDYLARNGNLKEGLLKVQMAGFDQTIDFTSNIWQEGLTVDQKIKATENIKARIEKQNQAEIDNYFPILYNQALILACTIFDLFLVESLKTIITEQKNTLKTLASKDDITIFEVIDCEDYESVSSKVQGRVLDRFDFSGIEDKLKTLKKIGLDLDIVFQLKLSKKEVQNKYPNGEGYLKKIYGLRNDIVHRNLLPIKSYPELSDISFFLQSLVIGIAHGISQHFNIEADFLHPNQNQNNS
jgi:hypothetical protein